MRIESGLQVLIPPDGFSVDPTTPPSSVEMDASPATPEKATPPKKRPAAAAPAAVAVDGREGKKKRKR